MRAIILIVVLATACAKRHHTPKPTLDPHGNEMRMRHLEEGLEDIARQLMVQQIAIEERIRSDGDSGIKQLRLNHKGTRPFFGDTHSMGSINAIHDHTNYITTIGMGEVIAVLNGVEFRTRHNDYKLAMPSKNTTIWHKTEKVPFPEVPPSVKSKHTIKDQIAEMKNYFKAWRDQNPSFRDYRPYFKPVLCYMEGAWTTNTKTLDEPFSSDRHFVDASSWFDLQEKIRFTSYTGGKHNLENFSFLPTSIINMRDNVPEFAQWNYRILCHPIKGDIPLRAIEPVDDLASRLAHKYNLTRFAQTRSARFHLASDVKYSHFLKDRGYGSLTDKSYTYGLLDYIMHQIPGKDNYPAKLFDDTFGMQILDPVSQTTRPLNTGYYHRRIRYDDKGKMATSQSNRGFADNNLWVAQTSNNHVAAMVVNDCQKVNSTYTNCTKKEVRYTYAIPLEIIYLTPLHTWNPYDILFRTERGSEGHITNYGKRNGEFTAAKAYNGSNFKYYYLTPTEFFSGTELNHDAADTVKNSVGVLDKHGAVRRMSASGTRIFFPNIPGVGVLRQRWPIPPIHREGSVVAKQIDAMKEMVNNMATFANVFEEKPTYTGSKVVEKPDAHFRTTLATHDPPGRHYHEMFVQDADYNLALHGQKITATTTEESSHTHEMEFTYNGHTRRWEITKCDGLPQCWDGHSNLLTKVA